MKQHWLVTSYNSHPHLMPSRKIKLLSIQKGTPLSMKFRMWYRKHRTEFIFFLLDSIPLKHYHLVQLHSSPKRALWLKKNNSKIGLLLSGMQKINYSTKYMSCHFSIYTKTVRKLRFQACFQCNNSPPPSSADMLVTLCQPKSYFKREKNLMLKESHNLGFFPS